MVEAQVDPMEPPKHKHKKVPRGPPSPPAPVLHSPPRKLTVKDQQEWKVPARPALWNSDFDRTGILGAGSPTYCRRTGGPTVEHDEQVFGNPSSRAC